MNLGLCQTLVVIARNQSGLALSIARIAVRKYAGDGKLIQGGLEDEANGLLILRQMQSQPC